MESEWRKEVKRREYAAMVRSGYRLQTLWRVNDAGKHRIAARRWVKEEQKQNAPKERVYLTLEMLERLVESNDAFAEGREFDLEVLRHREEYPSLAPEVFRKVLRKAHEEFGVCLVA